MTMENLRATLNKALNESQSENVSNQSHGSWDQQRSSEIADAYERQYGNRDDKYFQERLSNSMLPEVGDEVTIYDMPGATGTIMSVSDVNRTVHLKINGGPRSGEEDDFPFKYVTKAIRQESKNELPFRNPPVLPELYNVVHEQRHEIKEYGGTTQHIPRLKFQIGHSVMTRQGHGRVSRVYRHGPGEPHFDIELMDTDGKTGMGTRRFSQSSLKHYSPESLNLDTLDTMLGDNGYELIESNQDRHIYSKKDGSRTIVYCHENQFKGWAYGHPALEFLTIGETMEQMRSFLQNPGRTESHRQPSSKSSSKNLDEDANADPVADMYELLSGYGYKLAGNHGSLTNLRRDKHSVIFNEQLHWKYQYLYNLSTILEGDGIEELADHLSELHEMDSDLPNTMMPISVAHQANPLNPVPTPGETSPAGMENMNLGPADTDGHTHTGYVDAMGNGYTSTDENHNHAILDRIVQPGADGHTHQLIQPDEHNESLDEAKFKVGDKVRTPDGEGPVYRVEDIGGDFHYYVSVPGKEKRRFYNSSEVAPA